MLYKSIESNTSRDKSIENSDSFLKTNQLFNSSQNEILSDSDDYEEKSKII